MQACSVFLCSLTTPFDSLAHRNFTLLGDAEAFVYINVGIIIFSIVLNPFIVHSGTKAKLKWLYNQAVEISSFNRINRRWNRDQKVNNYHDKNLSEMITVVSMTLPAQLSIKAGMPLTNINS
ncbi:hypothetical protein [Shewanella sp. Isolate11]|uniref:hypothetical protein n=1 Tax=Shewanella sp. Isolate11 TaxID=2908530 RepID=UPI001EFDDC22|nr:hypothetical protein [Shewanella sp. Isolate11]MCG9695832.1 hypothetical protein [Shewanella sp. Isolate11]